jgi:hypothetical protein
MVSILGWCLFGQQRYSRIAFTEVEMFGDLERDVRGFEFAGRRVEPHLYPDVGPAWRREQWGV